MIMPDPDVQSVGIQRDLLAAAPLKKLQKLEDNTEETCSQPQQS